MIARLKTRERRLLGVAAVVVAIGLIEWGVVPVIDVRATLMKTLPQARGEADRLARHLEQLRHTAPRPALTEQALRQDLSAAQLTPTQIRLQGNGAEILFSRADLATVLAWVGQAEATFGLGMTRLDARWGQQGAEIHLGLSR